MAAEKLTKKRLMQIIIMLIILVSAFVWRYIYCNKCGQIFRYFSV